MLRSKLIMFLLFTLKSFEPKCYFFFYIGHIFSFGCICWCLLWPISGSLIIQSRQRGTCALLNKSKLESEPETNPCSSTPLKFWIVHFSFSKCFSKTHLLTRGFINMDTNSPEPCDVVSNPVLISILDMATVYHSSSLIFCNLFLYDETRAERSYSYSYAILV